VNSIADAKRGPRGCQRFAMPVSSTAIVFVACDHSLFWMSNYVIFIGVVVDRFTRARRAGSGRSKGRRALKGVLLMCPE